MQSKWGGKVENDEDDDDLERPMRIFCSQPQPQSEPEPEPEAEAEAEAAKRAKTSWDDIFEAGTQLHVLADLCCFNQDIRCPLCDIDISQFTHQQRFIHTNNCLDNDTPSQPLQISPVVQWLRNLGLHKYEYAFLREEIDLHTLHCLTNQDLLGLGVTALGPRKKILHALAELKKGNTHAEDTPIYGSEVATDQSTKIAATKLITDYFPGPAIAIKKDQPSCSHTEQRVAGKENVPLGSGRKRAVKNHSRRNGKVKEVPAWCCIPGTQFRVDAFQYLRRDCSHWFLTHFHLDHYQGLTRSFCHGKIYCSSVTAKLVNMKIGIPWDKIEILPLDQKINIAGIDVTCLDANHCPGSIIIIFEPPNGKTVLHTGDFRFSDEMARMSLWQMQRIHTLILDTTYCNPQYDFPKQDAVIQFVIEAIQAEAFNPKTLFLIGSYTIGKERLFLEVAHVLRKKVYVTAAKLRIMECLGLTEEEMRWFTVKEEESHIHVVPMWTLASFKRLKHLCNQYASRYSLIVAFTPTGWTFGKGKKKSPGKRWQQGTIIRYEVPYSEHSSFTELKEFVKLVNPVNIIPSVNNDGPQSADAMISLLMSSPQMTTCAHA